MQTMLVTGSSFRRLRVTQIPLQFRIWVWGLRCFLQLGVRECSRARKQLMQRDPMEIKINP